MRKRKSKSEKKKKQGTKSNEVRERTKRNKER